jgi:hypothetical protein
MTPHDRQLLISAQTKLHALTPEEREAWTLYGTANDAALLRKAEAPIPAADPPPARRARRKARAEQLAAVIAEVIRKALEDPTEQIRVLTNENRTMREEVRALTSRVLDLEATRAATEVPEP